MMNGNILSIFNLDNIRFYQNACLNFLNNEQVCQDCLVLCPYQAIFIKDNLPSIKQNACTECGLCTAICPTLAFDNDRYPYMDLHTQVAAHPQATISCEKDQLHTKGMKLPCLLTIDLPLLLAISENQTLLKLYIGECRSCLRAPLATIKSHFANLKSDILALGSLLEIELTEDPYIGSETGPASGLTRRELLQSFSLKKFKNFEFAAEEPEADHEDDRIQLKNRVLFKRNLVAKHQHRLINVGQVTTSYNKRLTDSYQLTVAESCTGCDICARVCPTGALYWLDESGMTNLYFDSELCIGCDRCTLCSEQALTIHTIDFTPDEAREPILLSSFTLNRCQTCNDYFRSQEPKDECPICSKQRNRESFFTNF